jgi:bacteriocin biosynthesis cyclodehydratase domain-containing protein
VRPALRAGLLPLWRDRDTIQIGVDPRRAVALAGVQAATAMIGLLDGSRDRAQVVCAASQLGVPVPLAERMLELLAAAGVLIDFPAALLRAVPAELRALLLPELAAASLAGLDPDGGARVLSRRALAVVQVCGSGRIPAAVADLLTESGAAVAVTPMPADLTPSAPPEGTRAQGPAPVLVILCGSHPAGHPLAAPADRLRRDNVAHLAVSAAEAIGTIGPLVRPTVSACLRCVDLARAERDPAWPLIRAQLAGRQPDPPACNAVLAAAVAAQAAAQALQFIDRPDVPGPAENATLELVQPDWRWRRRPWPAHPACSCGATDADRPRRDAE